MLDGQAQPSPRPSRRTLNTMLLAAASTPLLLREQLNAQGAAASAPRPFRLDIPQARRMVRGLNDEPLSSGGVMVPTGFASSPREMTLLNPPENVVARNINLVHYTKMQRAGHFAFWEQPELMVADVRQFFRKLRS